MAEEKIEMKSLEDNLREAFELFDTDKDGEITLAELQKIMNMHGRAVNGSWRNLNMPSLVTEGSLLEIKLSIC